MHNRNVIQSARSTMKELVYSVSPGSVHEKLTEEFKQIKKLYSICSVPLDNHRISEMLTRDETWVYYFEPCRRVSHVQWLRKDQNRPAIAKRIKIQEKLCHFYFICDGLIRHIQVKSGRIVTGRFYNKMSCQR